MNQNLEKQFEVRLKNQLKDQEKKITAKLFKIAQDKENIVRDDFQKTLEVANSVLHAKERELEEQKARDAAKITDLEETLKTTVDKTTELNTLIEIMKKQMEEKQNELAAFGIEAEEKMKKAKFDHEAAMKTKDKLIQESKDYARHELVRVLETEFECVICNEMYVDAKILSSCAHAFCSRCITQWGNTRDQVLTCPTCRTPYTENCIKPFAMGRSVLDKIEDKLPEEILRRRNQLKQERR
uniref:E3 ubiquitin-protein ligase RNF8-A n=1 Tax=Cacopsylla melanoneura TaxID=428564 RepID=A0A8D8ZVX9_9HEMI